VAATGPELAAVSYHEAGHALAAMRCGRVVEALRIDADHSGLATIGPPSSSDRVRVLREELLIAVAGDIAEQRADSLPGWWRL
jgi:hypothetical protein